MKTERGAASIALALVLASCRGPDPDPAKPPDPRAEESRIREAQRLLADAVATKNAGGIITFYAPDAVMLPPYVPPVRREGLQRAWENLFEVPGIALEFKPGNLVFSDDASMAYDQGTYTFRYEASSGRQAEQGKYLTVWRKIGEQWKIAADMFNSSRPTAPR